jgi:Arc/MetJ-type ribon-helix-helix transcriptional regulator|tara:strand:- start:3033 stop:3185 length:153 start_codon:yes stop_codon:yes gene_type:complete
MTDLIHIRVGKKIRQEIEKLIDDGLFSNQSEITREALRTLILKYKEEKKK